jgi:hypothetical protein
VHDADNELAYLLAPPGLWSVHWRRDYWTTRFGRRSGDLSHYVVYDYVQHRISAVHRPTEVIVDRGRNPSLLDRW